MCSPATGAGQLPHLVTLAIHFCVAVTVLVRWCSDKLDSEAIVEFVRALCAIAQEELDPAHAPRVYGLTKIVEISHFNMSRIRQAISTLPDCKERTI